MLLPKDSLKNADWVKLLGLDSLQFWNYIWIICRVCKLTRQLSRFAIMAQRIIALTEACSFHYLGNLKRYILNRREQRSINVIIEC